MDPRREHDLLLTRRQLFGRASTGVGVAALGSLLGSDLRANPKGPNDRPIDPRTGGLADLPHFAPKAKRIIYLFQSGAPSQMDLFDYKPTLRKFHGQELPDSIRQGQRITGMTSGQDSFPVASSIFDFNQHGETGTWLSELIPHQGKIVDDVAYVKTVHTDAINHDPAITFIQSGSQQPGRPSMGAWMSYGLGSENQNLPGFVVLVSQKNSLNNAQPLFSRLWGAGFLPSRYQGVRFRSSGDPVLYLSDPPGINKKSRRRMLDSLAELNTMRAEEFGDPEIDTRIAQYEMAYRMQSSVPRPDGSLRRAGSAPSTFTAPTPASPAPTPRTACWPAALRNATCASCSSSIAAGTSTTTCHATSRLQSKSTDQPSAALVQDLKQRGMLDDTLVVWGGEFGRTVYCQGELTETNYGRDHHPRCFTIWMAGGGVKPGISIGETDDYCYNIVKDPVHIHDLQTTILHVMGIDHKKLTFKYQGRHFRLTDVHGELVQPALRPEYLVSAHHHPFLPLHVIPDRVVGVNRDRPSSFRHGRRTPSLAFRSRRLLVLAVPARFSCSSLSSFRLIGCRRITWRDHALGNSYSAMVFTARELVRQLSSEARLKWAESPRRRSLRTKLACLATNRKAPTACLSDGALATRSSLSGYPSRPTWVQGIWMKPSTFELFVTAAPDPRDINGCMTSTVASSKPSS